MNMQLRKACAASFLVFIVAGTRADESPPRQARDRHWLWSTAHAVPAETTSEQSGYFSIVEGLNQRLYVGTAKYGANAYLVEFDPATRRMNVVVDAQKEIGTTATGFASQAKIHTRNNVGPSGRIYFGTKQGYPKQEETKTDYPGGYPMVYDPATGRTRVYPIPVPHQGIISVTPDESRNIAYVSTCTDDRPIDSSHFLILDLESGRYRDLMDCKHMYAFIVVDHLGRAYHPILGGEIARYDPRVGTLERLRQTIDGRPPTPESLLAHPESHPINWDIAPDRKTLYAVAMSGNQMYSYDLTAQGKILPGRRLGPLVAGAEATDCRALCVGPDGTVWAGVAATFPKSGQLLHVVRYRPGDAAPTDLGPIALGNPDYTTFTDTAGKEKPHHHGVYRLEDGTLVPRYVIMGICAGSDGTVYVTMLYPFTVHAIRIPRVAGITTAFHHNAHADVILGRMLYTDTLDSKGRWPSTQLVSLFTDQVPKSDISRRLARERGVPIMGSVTDALTLGTGKLAVDGVFIVAEHGKYPRSDTGQTEYPKRRLFQQVLDVFDRSGRVVPVFNDKHLADNWTDAKWLYDEARRRKIPLMAGSSLPGLWRYPPADVRRGAKLAQVVVTSYGSLDAYGFHGLEVAQCLAERRAGGETGVKGVQAFTGPAVWKAGAEGVYDRALLNAALSGLKERPIPKGKRIEELVPEPVLFVVDYNDGLRVCEFTLNNAVAEWSAAWRYADDRSIESALFWTQEARPFGHFNLLLMGIERMMHTGKPTWPVERTLLTSGILDAAHRSERDGGKHLDTPWLDVSYTSDWNWTQPPPPPPGRPISGL
jgi:sugar lactone lactonase YvrE